MLWLSRCGCTRPFLFVGQGKLRCTGEVSHAILRRTGFLYLIASIDPSPCLGSQADVLSLPVRTKTKTTSIHTMDICVPACTGSHVFPSIRAPLGVGRFQREGVRGSPPSTTTHAFLPGPSWMASAFRSCVRRGFAWVLVSRGFASSHRFVASSVRQGRMPRVACFFFSFFCVGSSFFIARASSIRSQHLRLTRPLLWDRRSRLLRGVCRASHGCFFPTGHPRSR